MSDEPIRPADAAELLARRGVTADQVRTDRALALALVDACAAAGIRLGRVQAAARHFVAIRDELDLVPPPPPRLCPACRAVTIH